MFRKARYVVVPLAIISIVSTAVGDTNAVAFVPPPGPLSGKVGVAVREIQGDAGFAIAYAGRPISQLTFPAEGSLVAVDGDAVYREPETPWACRLSGGYAVSVSAGGTSTDEDFGFSGSTVHYSESDSDAAIATWYVEAAWLWQVAPAAPDPARRSIEIGLLLGYRKQSLEFDDSNLMGSYYYGTETVTYEGAVATYDVDFSGASVGVSLGMQPWPTVQVGGRFAVMPSLEAEGSAYWILRDYPFWQYAEGKGVIAGFRADWFPLERVGLYAAYDYVDLDADENGTEDGVLNGEPYYGNDIVDAITASYDAFTLGASVRF